jgi:hypothetical protein
MCSGEAAPYEPDERECEHGNYAMGAVGELRARRGCTKALEDASTNWPSHQAPRASNRGLSDRREWAAASAALAFIE